MSEMGVVNLFLSYIELETILRSENKEKVVKPSNRDSTIMRGKERESIPFASHDDIVSCEGMVPEVIRWQ